MNINFKKEKKLKPPPSYLAIKSQDASCCPFEHMVMKILPTVLERQALRLPDLGGRSHRGYVNELP